MAKPTPLARAIICSFPRALMPGCEVTGPRGIKVPGWDPQPGPVDLLVRPPGEPASTIAAELKVDDVDEVLWDLVKLAALARRPEIDRCYLI